MAKENIEEAVKVISRVDTLEPKKFDTETYRTYLASAANVAVDNSNYRNAANLIDKYDRTLEDADDLAYEDMKPMIQTKFKLYNKLGNKQKLTEIFNLNGELTNNMLDSKIADLGRIEAENINQSNEQKILLLEKEADVAAAVASRNRIAALGSTILATLIGFFFYRNNNQKKLISSQKETLESLNNTKDQIFAIIGHDLRKPAISFNGISKKVNYFIQKKDFESLDKLGNHIEHNAFALSKLTDNLLNWALAQRNVVPYNPMEINLLEVTGEIKSIFTAAATNKNINLTTNIAPDLVAYADINAIFTILTNLVDNAIKYTAPGGQVSINAIKEENGKVKIRVSDSGQGINKEKIKDIFLLRKEKSQTGTQGEKGTGLGLHLVKQLVEFNQGIITVFSQDGMGTSFDVTLPTVPLIDLN